MRVSAASLQAVNSGPAQSGSEVRPGRRSNSGQPSLHAPLASLSSADLIRSPSALMRGGPWAQLPWRPLGALSPITELPVSPAEGRDIVPETQSIDDSPLRPTVAPMPTQLSQARQPHASRDAPKGGGNMPRTIHSTSVATSPQQAVLRHNTREDSVLAAGVHASCPSQCQVPSAEPAAASCQHQNRTHASAGVDGTNEKTSAPQSQGCSGMRQNPVGKVRHSRKRANPEMTADVLVRDTGQSGASTECENRSGRKQAKQAPLAPDEANGASHARFQPPICDSQPKEVYAIVQCKRRRITATSVHTNARSKSVFKAAGGSEPVKVTQVCSELVSCDCSSGVVWV